MGFFTDLKEDLSQAVNELMPEEDVNELHAAHYPEAEAEQELPSPVEDDLASEEDIWEEKENWADDTEWEDDPEPEELSAEVYPNREMTEKLNTMLEKLDEQEQEQAGFRQNESLIESDPEAVLSAAAESEVAALMAATETETAVPVEPEPAAKTEMAVPEEPVKPESAAETALPVEAMEPEAGAETALPIEAPEQESEGKPEPAVPEEPAAEPVAESESGAGMENMAEPAADVPAETDNKGVEEVQMDWKVEGETKMDTIGTAGTEMEAAAEATQQPVQAEAAAAETASGRTANDEVAVITASMKITGDMVSDGSMDVVGTVEGNIDILGKLNITGTIVGNSKAMEVYAENARVTGEITTDGSVKVGQSSVIIGNIYATSAVIAGAVKGDIDVQGPVVLDTTAIVMGNIKSKSVQINNGAIIEGMCSQCYADVNPTSFFESFQ